MIMSYLVEGGIQMSRKRQEYAPKKAMAENSKENERRRSIKSG